eukprot:TRINITY_DN18388_c0_g1_i1.p1 TRINITY_DN18388_c0_g1~~TRINITY_DN18388_c0_g1_i1.p1  ORF type:complete len:571 (-),score=142.74 TRINITY_DN18388_c0_g1_i1:98-1810(-)
MDPYKTLGISASQVKVDSDIQKVRQKAKQLYKRYAAEGEKWKAKKVMEAFELVKSNMKKIGEGAYKLIGRGRKERELDRHFNHQSKEIKKDKRVRRTLAQARKGEKRLHLPGDKERIPSKARMYRKSRRRRRREHERRKAKKPKLDILQGLHRLAAVLPQKNKFPKVIKLLHRWIKEYMNLDSREYIFQVLDKLSKVEWIGDEWEPRQDVIVIFEYVLAYNRQWFDESEQNQMLAQAWQCSTVTFCKCFTDDAFTMNSTIQRLTEVFALIEKQKPVIDSYLENQAKREATKLEAKLEAAKLEKKEEIEDETKLEAKLESCPGKKAKGLMAEPVDVGPMASPGSPADMPVKTEVKEEDMLIKTEVREEEDDNEGDDFFGPEDDSDGESDEEEDAEENDGGECIALDDSDGENSVKYEVSSGGSEESALAVTSSSSEAEELQSMIFPTPSVGESLVELRSAFVFRCLLALFRNRHHIWARTKVDNFFQDIYHRRACLDQEQQTQVEAWQSRIKVLQKENGHKVGESNNILEAARPVVDSRETVVINSADAGTWSSKQTFDAREVNGGRNVIR